MCGGLPPYFRIYTTLLTGLPQVTHEPCPSYRQHHGHVVTAKNLKGRLPLYLTASSLLTGGRTYCAQLRRRFDTRCLCRARLSSEIILLQIWTEKGEENCFTLYSTVPRWCMMWRQRQLWISDFLTNIVRLFTCSSNSLLQYILIAIDWFWLFLSSSTSSSIQTQDTSPEGATLHNIDRAEIDETRRRGYCSTQNATEQWCLKYGINVHLSQLYYRY